MKIFKKLLIWSLIAASIESLMLFSLNKIYAQPVDSYKEEKSLPQKNKKTYNPVKMSTNAKNIKVSWDGKYISYYEDEILKIVNTEDESSHDVDSSSNRSICYSKWLPDSNLLLFCEKDNSDKISFYRYDANKNSKTELIDFDTKPLRIELVKNDTVDNITYSTANHVMYIKVLHKNGKSEVYKVNIMSQLQKMKNFNKKIGDISMLHNETNLIYEDIEEGEIKNIDITSVKDKKGKEKEVTKVSSIDTNENGEKVLLGTDDEDKIYLGIKENSKVSRILFGDLKTDTDQWKTLKLSELTDKKNIIITKEGSVYIKDNTKGCIKNLVSNTETKYDGTFIQIQDKYIYMLYENKVNRVLLK